MSKFIKLAANHYRIRVMPNDNPETEHFYFKSYDTKTELVSNPQEASIYRLH